MRKSLIVLAIFVAAITGCSNKPAAPSNPATPPSNQSNTGVNTPLTPTQTAPDSNPQNNTNVQNGSSNPVPKPPAGSANPLTITKQQYGHLNLNLTFGEVQKELGLGKLIKQTDHQAVYQYNGKNGGTAELFFWDGVLNSKSANDLK